MKIYNTLTKKKEEFVPIEPGKVRMYVCGPTVYNLIHIGNARPMIVFDTVRRYFEYKGYEVNYVSNFTDVDDKIIRKAIEEGVDAETISKRYIAECKKDMEMMNVKPATKNPQATLEIGGMIERIQSETRLASASMSQTLEQVDGGVRMAEQAAVSIGIIRDRSQAVVATVSDIASATAEQSSASQDIARHIEAIHAMVSQTDHSLGEAQQATEALRRLGDELARLVARFRL